MKIEMTMCGMHLYFTLGKVPKNAETLPINEDTTPINENITPISEEYQDYIIDETNIDVLAKQYAEELKEGAIYSIPSTSDLPQRYAIQDDVEIITDGFEKEIEDIMEGRR